MSARALRLLVVLMFVFAGRMTFAQAAAPDEEKCKEEFRAGVDAFNRGKVDEAYQHLEIALRIKPDDTLIHYLMEEAGAAVLERMMMEGGKIRETALRIMELAKGKAANFKRDDAALEALVMQLDSDKFEQVWEATLKLAAAGTWASKNLVMHLGDTKSEILRSNVMVTLSRMNVEATLAVVEALNSTDKLTQQNAAVVLGNIADVRGLAELRRVNEDGTVDAEVKRFVSQAIDKIIAKHPEEPDLAGKSAKEAYVWLAERYYRSHPSVMHYMFGDYVVWRWSADKNTLVGREVPAFAFNEELAEECCSDAVMIDNAYGDAWSLLACVSYAQWEESQIALEDGQAKLDMGWISADDLNNLKAGLASVEQANLLGQMVGNAGLYAALARSLKDNTAAVSVSIIWGLRQTAKWEELSGLGAPLAEALTNSDKRVRYAAAETIVALRPKQAFTNSGEVIKNLSDAVSETAVRVVLVIEPEDNSRNTLKENLMSLGCYVTEATDAKGGIMKAKEFPNEDLIVCDGTTLNTVVFSVPILGKNQAETSVLDSLKEDLRTKQIPVVVTAADQAELDKWKGIFKDEVQGYLLKGENAGGIKLVTEPLFSTETGLNRSKKRAERAAKDAAMAIASITIQDTIFTDYRNATHACIEALNGRPDDIRIEVARALGSLGDDSAQDALAKLLSDAGNPAPVRAACALALGRIFQQAGSSPNEDVFKALMAGITDVDMDVQRASSKAIGAAHLSPQQAAQMFQAKRLHQQK